MARITKRKIYSNRKMYHSQKHPLLEYIFHKYNPSMDISNTRIEFTLADISEAYREVEVYRIKSDGHKTRIKEPASISNTILDLVRQNRGIQGRMPDSLIQCGYDLRKKTGGNLAGEFVYVGVGNEINSWMKWTAPSEKIDVSSSPLPNLVLDYLRRDEGALFSVIDYCDVLSQAIYKQTRVLIPVQHPLKWQPNEIDGFYVGVINGIRTLFPIEAKALTTHDEINLDQMLGGVQTISANLRNTHAHIIPLAIKMIKNGIQITVFSKSEAGDDVETIQVERTIEVSFIPPIRAWL
jgi:hypothetical protein